MLQGMGSRGAQPERRETLLAPSSRAAVRPLVRRRAQIRSPVCEQSRDVLLVLPRAAIWGLLLVVAGGVAETIARRAARGMTRELGARARSAA